MTLTDEMVASSRLKGLLKWSDRLGSDEIHEIKVIIKLLKDSKSYTLKQMEKSFIAGGKLCRNIENDSFDEFIKKLKP